jgi:hypothetical protein
MRKGFALLLILILTLSSSIMIETSFASITKPSIPQFTVEVVDSSYDVPTSYSIDPYTGATVTNPAKHVDNRTLEFTVRNQPFTPYYDASSSFNITLYYNVRMKGHYAENWTNLYSVEDNHPSQSNSEYTVIFLPLGVNSDTALQWLPSSSSQVDFQVEAMIGYFSRTVIGQTAPWSFTGEESGWSNTQTLTIGTRASTTTPNTSPSSTSQDTTTSPDQSYSQNAVLFGLGWIGTLVLLGIIAVLLVAIVVFLRKRSNSFSQRSQ